MTKERCLELLTELYKGTIGNTQSFGMAELAEAIRMAIEALSSSEMTNRSDDLISRQDAIDKFEPWLKVEGYNEGELNMLKAILFELTVMPSAQPERKKGKWIYNSPVTMKCDLCGVVVRDWYVNQFRFCPNCGCEMER